MEENNNKTELKDLIHLFYSKNNSYVFIFFTLTFILLILFISINIYQKNKNEIISEKFIKAGIYLSSKQETNAYKIYKEIILSKNKFYSILALNTIIEKNLETDKSEILTYFNILENLKIPKDQKDIIYFKKALYLLKILDIKEGNKLLSEIINSGSKLKPLAQDILNK